MGFCVNMIDPKPGEESKLRTQESELDSSRVMLGGRVQKVEAQCLYCFSGMMSSIMSRSGPEV